MPDLADFERVAVDLAATAGQRALEAFRGSLILDFKGTKRDDPVTVVDRDTETFLRQELRAAFPDHGLLGEEHADDIAPDASYVWVIDPIDGTMNFASGLPLWGISVGLLCDGAPVVGCIWVPVGPSLSAGVYHARVGSGAFFDRLRVCVAPPRGDERGQIMGLPGGGLRPVRFRRLGRNVPRPLRALPDQRTTGSCTAELALIASGVLRAGLFVKPSIWDVAAGALIVREAGGTVLTWRDRAWQPLESFEPMPPGKRASDSAPALRHWARPLLMGAPDAVERLTARMAWLPRPPKPLQQLLGL